MTCLPWCHFRRWGASGAQSPPHLGRRRWSSPPATCTAYTAWQLRAVVGSCRRLAQSQRRAGSMPSQSCEYVHLYGFALVNLHGPGGQLASVTIPTSAVCMMDLSLTENDVRGRLPAGWAQHSGFGHLAYGIQIYPHLVSARPIRGFSPRAWATRGSGYGSSLAPLQLRFGSALGGGHLSDGPCRSQGGR